MAKVAVIGSNSFSGSHFVDYLLEKTDYEVVGISRSPEPHSIFLPYKTKEKKRFKFFQENIVSGLERLIQIFKKEHIEYVVNFAAQGMVGQSWNNPVQWIRTNTLGVVDLTHRLVHEHNELKKYVQVSSPEVYGSCEGIKESLVYNPSSPYAVSKAAGDMFVQLLSRQFHFPGVFTRATNVYGPGQQLFRIIPRSIIYMKLGKIIELQGGGEAVKSYIHIKDVCEGTLKIMEAGRTGEVYHLSPDSSQSIREIVGILCKKLGKTFENSTRVINERIGQDAKYIIDSSKARSELSWEPKISINEGLDQCIMWVNKNWGIIKKQPLEYMHKE